MLLEGKTGLILGIANKRSLAWGIAQSVAREGARLAVTFQGERLEENVRGLAAARTAPHRALVACLRGCFADVPELKADRSRLLSLRARGGCCPPGVG